tara:strand:- start:890 stop:2227 length:1338 start_codon:yes stop_codon:yes gene_type:complete
MLDLKPLKYNYLFSITKISFYTFPISLIAGSLIVNLNIIVFTTLGIIFCFLNKIKFRFNLINISLLLFFLIFILSSYRNLNEIGTENFVKSIFLIKFFLLYAVLEILIKNTKFEIKYFFNICFFSIFFLSLDLSIQYFFGKNTLGFVPHEGRISGIFGHEAIAGAYLQKIFIFSLISMFFFQFDSKNNKKSLYLSIILASIIFGSFVASNRISFIILILSIFLFIFLFKILRKNLIYSIILILPVLFVIYQNDPSVNARYNGFFFNIQKLIFTLEDSYFSKKKNTNVDKEIIKENESILKNTKINPSTHARLFSTAFESFKEKIYLGNGYKSFRTRCVIFTNKSQNYLCSTHPHNYHLEVLHDTGIIGFLILTFFIVSLLLKVSIQIFKSDESNIYKIILSLLLINLLIELFPFKSTGSLFTSWNGTLVWLAVSLINYKNHEIRD